MKVISYLATLPKKQEPTPASLQKQNDKSNTLRYFVEGVTTFGDGGRCVEEMDYSVSDVAMILGWVHEHGKTASHLQFRKEILDKQTLNSGRTVIADSNLFLYKNTENPGYWLRYSYDGIFPNTGEYCDSDPDPERWNIIQREMNISLQPWRTKGDHILLCLQRDGGWSMAGWDVVDWALKTIVAIRQTSRRPIRIRPHPGDKRAQKYCDRLLKLCRGRNIQNVSVSTVGSSLTNDLANAWCQVNHNSSPGVAAAIEGIPVFVTDPERSQAREIANTDLAFLENPVMPDRQAWICRIAQFHWSHEDLRTGRCWAHMRKWAKK